MNKVKSVDLFSHISAPLPYPTKQYAEQTKKIGILSQVIFWTYGKNWLAEFFWSVYLIKTLRLT